MSREVRRTRSICSQRVLGAFLREPESHRFLLREGGPNRIFALTVPRIWLAYRLGVMRYGILSYTKTAR